MILAFRLFILFVALFALASLVGKRLKRNRKAMEAAEVDAELQRLYVHHFCDLKEPKP